MILTEEIDIRSGRDDGEIVVTKRGDMAPQLRLAEAIRMAHANGWRFGREIKVEAVVPVYLPTGMFAPGVHAHNLDDDMYAHLIKKFPELKTDERPTDAVRVE
jgi:hypothetical protein